MGKIPQRVKEAMRGSISPQDMAGVWKNPSELLGGLTPEQYYRQMGIDNFIVALQNGLAPKLDLGGEDEADD